MNNIELKYKKEINILKEYLINLLKGYGLSGIFLYGSAVNNKLFDYNHSDIDVIAFLKEFKYEKVCDIIKKIQFSKLDFGEKRPRFICDSLCSRIEFYYCTDTIDFDITISSGLIPDEETLVENACYDSFEALIGGVYLNSHCLYGKFPDEDLYKEKYFPFYNDDLRNVRLNIISERIMRYNDRIKQMWEIKNVSALDHIYKLRKLLLKYIFINEKTYYYTPEKNINYQLSTLTSLSEKDIKTISFMSSCDYNDLIFDFTNIVDKLLNMQRNDADCREV